MSERNNQLTSAFGYDVKNMFFSEPVVCTIPKTSISYKRVYINTQNPDKSVGDLIMQTERVFSFGVSENVDQVTKKVNGYVLPLCLYSRNKPTKAEKEWVETFNKIIERCKDYILENKEALGLYDLTKQDLKKLNPLYYKKEQGKIVEGSGPTLYTKLMESKKNNKINTMFFDKNGETIDPLSIMKKYCYTTAAVKFESIFIGNKISIQIKIYEAQIEPIEHSVKSLMKRPAAPLSPKAAKKEIDVDVDSDVEIDIDILT